MTKEFYWIVGMSLLVLKAWFIVLRTHAIKISKSRIHFHDVFVVLLTRSRRFSPILSLMLS